MSDWQTTWNPPPGEAYVTNGTDFVFEADSVGTADAWIDAAEDYEERMGLPRGEYRIVRVRATPGGKDIR